MGCFLFLSKRVQWSDLDNITLKQLKQDFSGPLVCWVLCTSEKQDVACSHSFVGSMLLTMEHMPGTLLGAGDTAVDQRPKPLGQCLHSGEGTHTDNQSKKTGSRTGGAKAYAKAKDQHSVGNGRCCCIWRGNKTFLSQKWAFEQRRERYTGASHAAIWSEPQQQGCEGAARLSWSRRARRSVWPVSGRGQGQVLGSTKGTFPLHSYIAPEFG